MMMMMAIMMVMMIMVMVVMMTMIVMMMVIMMIMIMVEVASGGAVSHNNSVYIIDIKGQISSNQLGKHNGDRWNME